MVLRYWKLYMVFVCLCAMCVWFGGGVGAFAASFSSVAPLSTMKQVAVKPSFDNSEKGLSKKDMLMENASLILGLSGLGITILGISLALSLFTGIGLVVSLAAFGIGLWLRLGRKVKGKKIRWALISSGISLFLFLAIGGLVLFF